VPAGADQWFWDVVTSPPDPGAGSRRGRTDRLAAASALLGVVGLAALLAGQLHHVGGVVDALVAALALGGTLSALLLGHTARRRAAAEGGRHRPRHPGLVGRATAWLSVASVVVIGMLSLADRWLVASPR
jgi:hypothetical protein